MCLVVGGQWWSIGLSSLSVEAGWSSELGSGLWKNEQTRSLHQCNLRSSMDTPDHGGKAEVQAELNFIEQ